ncbi:MAG: DUF1844 domain-containing protein [Bacillota bacterium]|jgi:hypothetical protein
MENEDAQNPQGSGEEGTDDGQSIQGFPLEALTSNYLVQWFIATLAAKAWESMGLVANPLSQEVKVDLKQARVAIDAVSALAPVIEGDMDAEEASRLKALLRDLRINFVEKSKDS